MYNLLEISACWQVCDGCNLYFSVPLEILSHTHAIVTSSVIGAMWLLSRGIPSILHVCWHSALIILRSHLYNHGNYVMARPGNSTADGVRIESILACPNVLPTKNIHLNVHLLEEMPTYIYKAGFKELCQDVSCLKSSLLQTIFIIKQWNKMTYLLGMVCVLLPLAVARLLVSGCCDINPVCNCTNSSNTRFKLEWPK